MRYDPRDWYWAGTPAGFTSTVIYSSRANKVVDATDPGYAEFVSAGLVATPWPVNSDGVATVKALSEVLSVVGIEIGIEDPDATLDDLRAAKLEAITAKAGELLGAGAPVANGLHIFLDDASRADLTAMAATATIAAAGTVLWPESYSRGWIALENERIPLPTPTDGLMLAAHVGDYYATIVQHRRDLKDAALAAADEAALAAIDVTAGWPSNA